MVRVDRDEANRCAAVAFWFKVGGLSIYAEGHGFMVPEKIERASPE